MAKYIKSYSNYVLNKRHQFTNDGVVYSKDITTINSVDKITEGQVPIYRSGNFVITTNNDYTDYKKNSDRDWHRNDEGEVWTANVLKNYEKDEKSSDDKKIVIKKDYYDIRDFAYYGSCSELIRTSIENILKHYPGELFVPYETIYINKNKKTKVQYTEEAAKKAFNIYDIKKVGIKGYYSSFDEKLPDGSDITADEREGIKNGIPYKRPFDKHSVMVEGIQIPDDLVLMDNPFNIDMHSTYVPDGADPLRYFANDGISNYVGYMISNGKWLIDKEHEYTLSVNDVIYDGLGEREEVVKVFNVDGSVCDNKICTICNDDSFSVNIESHKSTEKTGNINGCAVIGAYIGRFTICFTENNYSFSTYPTDIETNGQRLEQPIKVTSFSTPEDCNDFNSLNVYMFMGDDYKVKYLVKNNPSSFKFRIRPKETIIENFFDSLSSFEKILLNRNSDVLYTADFELIGENENGLYKYTKSFTFPTTYGDFNLGSTNQNFKDYVSSLSEISQFYDELFTDNLWRSMTHEAIKNFDWTYTRSYTKDEEIPFIEGGNKIQKIIRVYGREFDEIKSYIDAIDDLNTVTYDNVNNLPDYFFTDKLENYGWDVKLVHPLILTEYINNHMSTPINIWDERFFPDEKYDENHNPISTAKAEQLNYFYDKYGNKVTIQRVFNQDFSELKVKPYYCPNTVEEDNNNDTNIWHQEIINAGDITPVDEGIHPIGRGVTNSNEQTTEDENDCPVDVNVYCNDNEFSSADVNTEFMKRLILNSESLWAHKGTIDGIEMLLSLFGLRSKKRVYTDDRYFNSFLTDGEENNCLKLTTAGEEYYSQYDGEIYNLYDYDIKEYTLFTTNIEDEWDENKNMYVHDWINSTKLNSYTNNTYESYQGLPVSYKEEEIENKDENDEVISTTKIRYLYPHFNSYEIYDGNPYYQMNGGWMQKTPFMFDAKNNIVVSSGVTNEDTTDEISGEINGYLFTETVKNIKCVNTLRELLSNYSLANRNGDICQVLDISGRYAIIDGYVYDIYSEQNGNDTYDFIYATIENNSLSIGNAFFTDYVIISNPYEANNRQRINISDEYFNNREIKIYIIKTVVTDEETGEEKITYSMDAYSKESSISTFTVFENGKYMEGDNYTNYFVINNINYFNELSVLGWRQLKDDEYAYYKMNTIVDDREGNNPHNGHMRYDNGYEYLTYFKQIFKHAYDNDTFDYRLYTEDDMSKLNDIGGYGFSDLIGSGECDYDYDMFLREDSKCHYFGNINSINNRTNLSCFKHYAFDEENHDADYLLTDVVRKTKIDDYGETDEDKKPKITNSTYGEEIDDTKKDKITKITDQIVNTKRMDIDFYIHNSEEYSKEWLEEIKYIDAVILPYLYQMVPSNIICRINYKTRA